ncbi:MAG: NUDIX domain-containing protein [Spirochaetes bacterium]|nr:NUDIX domain-containing protein [Spirochaetota bacterium]
MFKRSDIIKSMLPGLLPLLVFIIFDAFFEPDTAVIAAVVFSLMELGYHFFRYRKFEKFVLFDIILISVLGVISVSTNNPLFFKLKPAIIEGIIVIVLAVSVFTPANIILMMTQRYMKGIKLSKEQIAKMRQSCLIMFLIFTVHTAMIVYSALYMSQGAWAFISGVLFYILFGIYFIIEITFSKYLKYRTSLKYKNDEWFDILSEDGKITGRAPRSLCHGNPDLLHAAVHLQVFNSAGDILLQKRSSAKDVQPGKWDSAVGGHVNSGELIENAVIREASEELKLTGISPQPFIRYIWRSEIESEMIFSFYIVKDDVSEFDPVEIDEIRYFSIKKIEKLKNAEQLTPNFCSEFEMMKNSGLLEKLQTGKKK